MARFSLSWDAHKQNIYTGLSALQQNGEFVDMTIAADGHHVKVHQMVLSLVSPYIKDLIRSAQCPHPIIFLNKVSYSTLEYILQYIYTGEVLVEKEDLSDLVQAAKELHIKGLEDVKFELPQKIKENDTYFSYTDQTKTQSVNQSKKRKRGNKDNAFNSENKEDTNNSMSAFVDVNTTTSDAEHMLDAMESDDDADKPLQIKPAKESRDFDSRVQYTVSNQGSLQMILNRFMYYLRYTGRKGHRSWRCVDYERATSPSNRCPATVITKGDIVIERNSAHKHAFHDKKILKKVRDHAIYAAVKDAEAVGQSRKRQKLAEPETADIKDDILTETVVE